MGITIKNPATGESEILERGCYGDGSRGIYLGELVQSLASAYGWSEPSLPANGVLSDDECRYCTTEDCDDSCGEGDLYHDPDDHGQIYDEATNEAESFLNSITTGGYWTFDDGFHLVDPNICAYCDAALTDADLEACEARYAEFNLCASCDGRNSGEVAV